MESLNKTYLSFLAISLSFTLRVIVGPESCWGSFRTILNKHMVWWVRLVVPLFH